MQVFFYVFLRVPLIAFLCNILISFGVAILPPAEGAFMFITVTCPKCGRSIKAKKKFVLSSGGVPCLKCRIRIPVSKEQVQSSSASESVADETPEGVLEAAPVSEETIPAREASEPAAAKPEEIPEAVPVPGSLPEPKLESALPAVEDDDLIKPAISIEAESEPASTDSTHPTTGIQIAFTCPYCQTSLPLRQSLAGKKIRGKGGSRIVKGPADCPVIREPEPEPPPPPPPEDDIPVLFSPAKTAHVEPAPVVPRPAQTVVREPIPETGPAPETIARLRKALSEAEERANSAEELLQQLNQDKTAGEMAAFRKTRELEAQIRDLTSRLKAKEEELRTAGSGILKRAEVESLLKTLCDALDANLKQELTAHQNLVDDLKRQLAQALH
jgi:hypothetical protein